MPYPAGAFKPSSPKTQNAVDSYTQQKVKELQKKRNADEAAAAKKKQEEAAKKRLSKINQQINSVNDDIQKLKDLMKEPQFWITKKQEEMAAYVATNNLPFDKTLWTSGQRAAYAAIENEKLYWQGIYDGYKKRLDTKTKELANLELDRKQAGTPYNSVGPHGAPGAINRYNNQRNNSTDTGIPPAKPANETLSWIYNAPLISQANFRGIQASVLDGNFITAGNFTDALNAFKIEKNTGNVIVGRGAFQTDRVTRNAIVAGKFGKETKYYREIDNNIYGFRFLYNPQTVTMNWGSLAKTDPVYQASAADPFVAGTANLVSSTIEFSILLNRIEDMNYLDKNGLMIITSGTEASQYMSEAAREGLRNTGIVSTSKNPYSGFNRQQDFKEIYEEGTMYDLKYLFKTMHAQGAYVTYKSSLQNQTTADPGWLPVRPVELHLGNKLRYRVRIQNMSVNHTIFNARMVPILSTVNISCARYWDDTGGVGDQK